MPADPLLDEIRYPRSSQASKCWKLLGKRSRGQISLERPCIITLSFSIRSLPLKDVSYWARWTCGPTRSRTFLKQQLQIPIEGSDIPDISLCCSLGQSFVRSTGFWLAPFFPTPSHKAFWLQQPRWHPIFWVPAPPRTALSVDIQQAYGQAGQPALYFGLRRCKCI